MTTDKPAGGINCLYCRLPRAQRREIKGRGDGSTIDKERGNERLHHGGFRMLECQDDDLTRKEESRGHIKRVARRVFVWSEK
jgi:hypothetical protein